MSSPTLELDLDEPAQVSAVISLGTFNGEISTEVLIEKYAKGDETTIDSILCRVVKALAEVESSSEVGYKNANLFAGLLTSGGLQRLILLCRAVSKVEIEPLRQSVQWCCPKYGLILLLYQKARAPPRVTLPNFRFFNLNRIFYLQSRTQHFP
jgi:hypothetical protein